MVSGWAFVTLVAVIAASLVANYLQYQRSLSLEHSVTVLQARNIELIQQLNNRTLFANSTYNGNQSYHQFVANQAPKGNQSNNDITSQSITAVAVKSVITNDGFFQTTTLEGALMGISVDIRNGEGRTLVNTEIPTGIDFQTSARTAVKVAQSLTGVDLSSKDIIFSITARGNAQDLQAADGPSAGSAMTILLVSELEGKKLKSDVLITGTIEQDGTVGPVGGIPEKAQAAGKYGAAVFLVPAGQAVYQAETCEQKQVGLIIYKTCQSTEQPLTPQTEKLYKMKVIEIHNVDEALRYFVSS